MKKKKSSLLRGDQPKGASPSDKGRPVVDEDYIGPREGRRPGRSGGRPQLSKCRKRGFPMGGTERRQESNSYQTRVHHVGGCSPR